MLSFGHSGRAIRLHVHEAKREMSWDEAEHAWRSVDVEVDAQGIRGGYRVQLHVEGLAAFRRQLIAMHQNLSGAAVLEDVDGQLTLQLLVNAHGQLAGTVRAAPSMSPLVELRFDIEGDQTDLRAALAELEQDERAK